MIQITDNNYKEIIEDLFKKDKIVVAMVGLPNCENCKKTQENITDYHKETKTDRISFVYMDYSTDSALTDTYYEMNQLDDYPKTVIYDKSWLSPIFKDGEITKEFLNSLEMY